MNFAQFAHKWGKATPDARAVCDGTRTFQTYAELSGRVARLGAGLLAAGLKPGDRVAILMENGPHYPECMLACWHAGLAAVPVNAKLHESEIAYILEQSGAELAFVSPALGSKIKGGTCRAIEVGSAAFEAMVRGAPMDMADVDAGELAWLFYTSGTTGKPKGAMITHRNLIFACHCYAADIDPDPPWSAILHPAPFSHGSGLYGLAHLMKGSCQVFPKSGGFDPAEIFDLIAHFPGAMFFAAPTMIRRLTHFAGNVDTGNLKCVVFGGAPMLVEDIKAFLDRFGSKLAQLYGQGEAPMTITGMARTIFGDRAHPHWEKRIASAGLPQSGCEVKVVSEDGKPVATGEVGEVITRSDCVVPGYWNNEDASATTFRDGWLWTGDMGSFDEDGFLTLSDRSKDMIISGGSNIYPREVEEVLARSPAVAEVSVIGRPDKEWGEIVVAYISLEEGQSVEESELNDLCLDNIARFKRPKAYRFVDALPKNNYGKILKTELREMENARDL